MRSLTPRGEQPPSTIHSQVIALATLARRSIWVDLLLYPTHTLPTAAAPAIVGVGLAMHDGTAAIGPAAAAFLASWLVHIAGVFTDNYQLLTRDAAVVEHPELTAAVNDGSLRLSALWRASAACLILAALIGVYLTAIGGLAIPIFGLIGICASLGYSMSPISMTRLGIADIVFFLMFGVVAVAGIYYVQAHALPFAVFVAGLPVGALVTNVLLIDDIRDRGFDTLKKWRTRPVQFGLRWTRFEFIALTTFAYVFPFWIWLGLGYRPWVLLPLLTLPIAVGIARTISTQLAPATLFPMTPKASALALQYAVLLAAGLAFR